MKSAVFLIAAMSLMLCQEGVFPLDLNTSYLLGSLRNATFKAGNYISDSIQKQKEMIINAKNTASEYVTNAVAVPRNALINAKNATKNYIDSTASKGIEVKFRAVMETIRVKMPYGIAALDIPPLDPLKIEHETYNLSHKDVGNISSTLDKATISGLSTFVIDRVKISVIGGVSLALNLSVPTIRGNGDYEVHGSIGRLFPLNSTGPFEFEAQDTRFYIHVVLGYSGSMYVKSLDTDFSIRSVKARFYHLFKNPEADKTMNEIISELVPQFLEIVKPEVKPRLEEIIAQRINASVARLNVGNILGILTGTIDLQTMAHLTTSGPQILQPLKR